MRRSRIVSGRAKPTDPSPTAIFAWTRRSAALGRGIVEGLVGYARRTYLVPIPDVASLSTTDWARGRARRWTSISRVLVARMRRPRYHVRADLGGRLFEEFLLDVGFDFPSGWEPETLHGPDSERVGFGAHRAPWARWTTRARSALGLQADSSCTYRADVAATACASSASACGSQNAMPISLSIEIVVESSP